MKKIVLLTFITFLSFAQIPTTNLRLWLRADAGLTTTTSNVINSNWLDQSPNALSVARNGSPVLIANALNGKPAVRFFTGSNFITANALVSNLSKISYYAVAKFSQTNTEIFNKSNHYGLYLSSNNTSARFFTNSFASNEIQYNNPSGLISNYFIYSGHYNLSTLTGALNSTISSGLSLNSAIPAGGNLTIGGGQQYWFNNGEIAELIIYNAALNTPDQQQVYNYLSAKYNIGINPNAPQITSFGTKNSYLDANYNGTRIAASGYAGTGDDITIVGSNFSSVTGLFVNNISISGFTTNSNSLITFTLPDGLNYVGQDFTGNIRLVNSFGSGFSALPLEVIYSNSAPVGIISVARAGQFSIEGTDLSQINGVSVGGINASFLYSSTLKNIVVNLSTTVGLGNRIVSVSQNTYLGNQFFDLADPINVVTSLPSPIITNVSPKTGSLGSLITISGTNFGSSPTDNVVYFGATKANVLTATSTTAVVQAPAGSTYQNISLLNLNSRGQTQFNPTYSTTFLGGGIFTANTFAAEVQLDPNNYYTYFSTVADLNGDGKPEIISAHKHLTNRISIFQNNAASTITAASFGSVFYLNTANQIYQIIAKDFDNDGKLDLAVFNFGGSVQIFRNIHTSGVLSASSFANPVSITVPVGGYAMDAADLDADGKIDIAVAAYSGTNSLYLIKNQFSGNTITGSSFAAPITISFGSGAYPVDLKLVDVDNDGRVDLATANQNNSGSSTISIFRNITSQGVINASTFATPITIATPNTFNFTSPTDPEILNSLEFADFDNDGKLDIAATNRNINSISVFKNKTTVGTINASSFNERVDFATGTTPQGLAVGDINGDGKIDIAVASEGEAKSFLFRNQSVNGTISGSSFASRFELPSAFQFNTQPHIVDMDGDGKPDLVISNWGQINIGIFKNLLTEPATITGFTPTSGLPLTRVTLTGSNFDNVTQVQMGTITGGVILSFSPTSIVIRIPAGATTNPITLINNSGSAASSAGTFTVAGLTPFAVITAVSPLVAPIGSLVTVFGSGFDTNPSLNLLWFGATKMPVISATNNIMVVSVVGGASSSKITYQNSFGLNEQFKLPLSYSFSGGNVAIGTFTNNATLNTGNQPFNVISQDLDGDGKPELIATNYNAGSNQLSIYRNNAINNTINGSSFAAPFNLSSFASNSFQTSVGDLDGDGIPDLLIPVFSNSYFSIIKNNSNVGTLNASTFAPKSDVIVQIGYRPYGSAIADIDNDGFNDLIFSSRSSSGIFIYRNLGNGKLDATGFEFANFWSSGVNPTFIQITDLDGDGKKDIIVGHASSTYLSVFRNVSTVGGLNASSLATKVDLQTPNNPYGIAFADINGDNKPEIICSNYGTSQFSIFQNNILTSTITAGSFVRTDLTGIANGNPYGIQVGDIDGDGKPEIVTSYQGVTQYSIFKNNYSTGNINASQFSRVDVNNSQVTSGLELADLDLDGKQEIIMANTNASTLFVYKNQIGNGVVPTITGFSPTSGLPLATFVTVSGFGFTSVSGVTLANVPANSFTVVNANTIVFRVPNTTLTGVIGIANQFGTVGLSSNSFTITGVAPIPVITSVSPINVASSDAITLSGNGFGTTFGQNVVYIGSEKVNILSQNNSTLVVQNQIGTNNAPIAIINTLSGLQGVANHFVNNTFAGPNTIVTASFASFIATITGASSYANEIADLDGDGRNDLISVGYGSNSISVFRNISTVGGFTFASRQDFTVDLNPFGLVVADFDNDGRKDIAVGNYSSNSISVFKNNSSVGTISLASRIDILTTGVTPFGFMNAGDIDGDGFLDLAIPCDNNNTLVLLKNQGIVGAITASTFGNRLDYTGLSGIFDAQILDLDGDNKNDLVYLNTLSPQIIFRKNIGLPSAFDASVFGAPVSFATSSSPTKMTIRDFDRDGKNDIAVSNQSSSFLTIFKNNVIANTITGTSFSSFTINSLSNPYGIVSADIDGDGRLDLVHSSYTSAFIGVNRNISTVGGLSAASFAPTVSYPAQDGVYGLSEGDLDGDGKTDIVGSTYSSNTLNIWRNLSMGTPSITGFNPTSGQAGVTFVTLTGLGLDGVNRVSIGAGTSQIIISATANQLVFKVPASAANGQIIASNVFGLNATSTGTFTISAPYPYPSIAGISPLFNNFNNTISITGNNFSTVLVNNLVYIGAARATVTGASATNVTALVPSGSTYDAVTLLNRDNGVSLTGTNYSRIPSLTFAGANTINDNTFGNRIDIVSGNGGRNSVASDFDNDGKNDIAVGYSSTINVYRNTSTIGTIAGGSFASSTFSIAGNPTEIAVADFDNDGKLDIVAGNQNSNNFSVLRNISSGVGNIAFAPRVDFTSTPSSTNQALSVADIDLDGFMDVIVKETIGSNYQISIFRNSGIIGTITGQTFTEKIILALGTNNPNDIEITDLNGDNYPEIVLPISNLAANNIYVYRNNSRAGFVNIDVPTFFSTFVSQANSVRSADFDNDGKRDLVIGHIFGSSQAIKYFRNTSTLTSITGLIFNYTNLTTPYTDAIDVGDMDGDGRIDVVLMDISSNSMRVYRNTSTSLGINQGTFAESVSFPSLSVYGVPHLSDLDGDGRPEIFQFNTSGVLSIWNNLISNPATITGISPNPAIAGVSIVTVIGLGLQSTSSIMLANSQPLSIIGANATSFTFKVPASGISSVLTVTNLTGAMSISNQVLTITAFPYPTITSVLPTRAANGESVLINGNNFSSITGNNFVYFGAIKASVTAASNTQLTVNAPVGAMYENIWMGNRETNLLGQYNFPLITTFSGVPTILGANYATAVLHNVSSSPVSQAIGDLDGDGKLDLVVANQYSTSITIYRNISNPGSWTTSSFASRLDISIGNYPYQVAISDFDLDGKLDIVFIGFQYGEITILKNNSNIGSLANSDFSISRITNPVAAFSLAVSDMDLDGFPDMVVGASSNLYVYKNKGITTTITSSSFENPISFPKTSANGQSNEIKLEDLNGDNKPEIICSNIGSVNQSIFENRTKQGVIDNTSFTNILNLNIGSGSTSVAVADLDNDGRKDLIFPRNSNNRIVIYRNISTNSTISAASFESLPTLLITPNASNSSVYIADLDGDGKLDILSSDGQVVMFKNNISTNTITSGLFSSAVILNSGVTSSYIKAADMDGDGKTDIVSGGSGGSSISVIRLNINLLPTTTGFNPTSASPFAIISISGNNLNTINQVFFGGIATSVITVLGADAILAQVPINAATGNIVVTNTQGASSTAPGIFTVIPIQYPSITGISPSSVTAGSSLVVNGLNFNTVAGNNLVQMGAVFATVTGATATQLTINVPNSASYDPIQAFDTQTKLRSNYSIPANLNFPNSGTIVGSSFAGAVNYSGLNSPYFSINKDLNGDGKPEILVVNYGLNYLTIFVNNAAVNSITGSSFSSFNIILGFNNVVYVVADDLDNDGRPDLAIADYNSGRVAILKNNFTTGIMDANSFGAPQFFATGSQPYTLATGDIDFDGFNDIVVANFSSNSISVLKNKVTPGLINSTSFATKQDFLVGSNPVEIGIADLDNDGKLDIITSNAGTQSVSILKNTASRGIVNSGSFSSVVNFTTPYNGYGLGLGDFNNDGKIDILCASSTNAFVMVYQNNTTGNTITGSSFNRIDISAPIYGQRNAKIADFDGDGKNDFAVPTSVNQVSVYRNISTGVGLNVSSFAARVNYSTQNYPWGLSVGDLDGDFKPEIVAINNLSNSLSILKNLQSGSNPTITALNPLSLIQGQSFTINGTNFAGITSLRVNGQVTPFTISSASIMVSTLLGNATTGFVSITGFNGSAVSPGQLIVIPLLIPTITGFNQTSALPGSVISVLGNNFVSISGVSISGISVPFSIVNSQLSIITVPSAITGKATIVNYSGQTQSLANFQILTNAGADFGRMAFFDGSNNFINIPSAGNVFDNSNFTFEAMVKRGRISAPNGQDRLFMSSNFGGIGVYFENNRLTLGKIGVLGVSTNNAISDTLWHHLAVSYNGSVAKFYYDGNFDSQQAFTQTFNSANSTYNIGARSGSELFQGRIDEVRIWNTERTIGGINASRCGEINGNEPSLVGYYRMNENPNSTTVLDASPSGLHANVQNFTLPTERPVSTAKCYQAATILGFSPNPIVGGSATILSISGLGFTDIVAVRLANFNLPSFTVSGNNIFLTMPTTVTNANLIVVNGTETTTSTGILTVTGLVPTVTSITPNAQRRGRMITILGNNFENISGLTINGINTSYTLVNSQTIISTIAGNATIGSGNIAITNLAGIGASSFTVTGTPAPTVTGVSPAFAMNGNLITATLSEIEFMQGNVTIGGTTISAFTVSGNSLSFVVPIVGITGHVRISTLYGGISPTLTGALLTILQPPTISDFGAVATGIKLASSGCFGLGELVTISGNDFALGMTDVTLNNFNVLNPTVTSANMILLRIPDLSGFPTQNLTGKFVISTPRGSIATLQNMAVRFCASTPTTTLGIKNNDDFEITGNDLVNVTAVSVAGISASFNTYGSKLTVIVPNAAPSGFVKVTINQGTYSYMFPFDFYIYAKPTITGIIGSPALVGSTISIVGTALSSTTGVAFNGANQTTVSNISSNLITLLIPVGASNGNLNLTAIGGIATSPLPFVIAPNILSVFPTAAGIGRAISISGTGLNAVSQILFNGLAGSIQSKSASSIVVNVPNGATSGNLTARIISYTTSGVFFRVVPAPTISDITPGSAIAGSILTISGTGFSAAGINTLSFNNTGTAIANILNDNIMTVIVPGTASSGYITLTNLGGSTTSNNQFLAIPSLSGEFNPYGLGAGGTITIFGNNLFNPTLVSFNNNLATTFSFQNANQIIAIIPNISSLTPINVKVSTDGGTSNIALYTIAGSPNISSILPGSGKAGDIITVIGDNFSLTSNTVLVNGATATHTVISKTKITVVVPTNCIQGIGNIQVQNIGNQYLLTPNNFANSPSNFAVIPSLSAIRELCDTNFVTSVTSAIQGEWLRIEGSNFINANTQVFFNSSLGAINNWSSFCNGNTNFSTGKTINVKVPNNATTGNVTVKTNGGISTAIFLTIIPPPIISGFSPLNGVAGTIVTISGSQFHTVSGVSINSISAPFLQLSPTSILATITGTMSNGKIAVSATGGSTLSNLNFAPTPVITSILPVEAPANSDINLIGTNLYGAISIDFAGINASNWNDGLTNSSVRVPLNANSGTISYTNAGGTAVSPFIFTVSTILGISTSTGVAGTMVTITGIGLTSASTYNFVSTAQYPVLGTVTGGVIVSVPGAATFGAITLNFSNGGSTSFGSFRPIPIITAISPNMHGTDQFVEISGSNIWEISAVSFGEILSNNLGFNSGFTSAQIVRRSSVKVPTNALSGIVSLTVAGGGTATSPTTFIVISISGVLPGTALAGTEITITGANLDNISGLSIGATSVAGYTSAFSRIITTIPSSISSGQIVVSKGGGYNDSFAINLPDASITGISPIKGSIGTVVTINGINLTAARSVQLYNGSYNPFIFDIDFQVVSSTRIVATVTGNGISGNIRVVGQNNNIASGGLFTMPPVLNTLPNPGILPSGQAVVLNGGNLTDPTTINIGGINVPVINYGAGSISFVMPTIVGNNIITAGNSAGVSTVNFSLFSIASLSTNTGFAGQTISISGTSFANATAVMFNNVNTAFTVVNGQLITAIVPNNAGNGSISVTSGGYTINSNTFNPRPLITGFAVLNGVDATTARLGSTVSLVGTNLNNISVVTLGLSSNAYSFNTFCTSFNNGSSITPLCVPSNATSGIIVATTGLYTASIAGFNFIAPPGSITGVAAIPGSQVTINGLNLNTVTGVSFAGNEALSFTQISTTQLIAIVPYTATISGNTQVRTQGGNTTSTYIAPPIITAISKSQGAVGIGLAVSAFNISGINQVIFPVGITATGTNNFADNISVNVPFGATNGFISVQNEAGLGVSPFNFDVLAMPTINFISPSNGGENTLVLINGTNLDLITNVFFGNSTQPATFIVISPTQIQATAPVGVLTGKISVRNANLYPVDVFSAANFVGSALFTSVINISNGNAPYIGRVGESIQINGANFTAPVDVYFNNIKATTSSFVSSTQITAQVPVGATTGVINVSVSGGDYVTPKDFEVVNFASNPVAIVTNSCAGQSFRVNYSVTGFFPNDNIFYVDMMNGSNVVGTAIGRRDANSSGFVSAIIPSGLAGIYTSRIRSSSAVTNYSLASANSNTINITNLNNWLGYTNNWSENTNWGCGELPNSQSYVVIDNSPIGGNQPTIFGSATSGTLQVSGGQLTITTSGVLTLFGDLKLSSTSAFLADPTSFTLINGANASVVSSVGHVEVGNITIATNAKLTLGSPLKVKGSFVNNVNTYYYSSYYYGWYNIYGFNSNGNAVTIEGSNLQTVGNPGYYATLFDELVLNNNTSGAGVALGGPVQVKCKLINYGIFNANNFLTEFVNGPCAPVIIASPQTNFHDITFSNTLTAIAIQNPIRVRGNFRNAPGAQGITMSSVAGVEYVGTTAPQTIEANGQILQYQDLTVSNPFGVSLSTVTSTPLRIRGNFRNNGIFTDLTNTISFTGTNTTIGGTGEFNLNNIELAHSGAVTLASPIRLRGNFRSLGTFNPGGQTVTFNSKASQTISGTNIVTLAGITITDSTKIISQTSVLAIIGNIQNSGIVSITSVSFGGNTPQKVEGSGVYNFGTVSNTNEIGVVVNSSLNIAGNFINEGNIKVNSGLTTSFTGNNQIIGGTNMPILANVDITPTSTVTLNRGVRVSGNFKASGSFVPNNQIVNFAATGGQTIESATPLSFSGIKIETGAQVVSNVALNINGSVNTNGMLSVPQGMTLSGSNTQNIAGNGNITVGNLNNLNTSPNGLQISTPLVLQGNMVNDANFNTDADVKFNGNNQSILGTAMPQFTNVELSPSASLSTKQPVKIRGNFSNNSLTKGLVTNNLVILEGITTQTIGGTALTTFAGLLLNNTAGVLATNPITANKLTLSGGNLSLQNGQSLKITSTDNNAVVRSTESYVVGNISRNLENPIGKYEFPVGTSDAYRGVAVDFTIAALGKSYLDVSHTNIAPPLTNSFPFDAALVSMGTETLMPLFWTIEPTSTLTGGKYSITFDAQIPYGLVADPSQLLVVKRHLPTDAFELPGTGGSISYNPSTGVLTANRSSITGFSQYALASTCANIVNVSSAKPIITQVGFVLSSLLSATQYQWSREGVIDASLAGQNISPTKSGIYRVRVKQTGCFSGISNPYQFVAPTIPGAVFTIPSGLNSSFSNEEVRIYPNPASRLLNIEIENAKPENYHVSVFDLIGKQHLSQSMAAPNNQSLKATLNISQLSQGIYFVKITKNGEAKVLKLLVE